MIRHRNVESPLQSSGLELSTYITHSSCFCCGSRFVQYSIYFLHSRRPPSARSTRRVLYPTVIYYPSNYYQTKSNIIPSPCEPSDLFYIRKLIVNSYAHCELPSFLPAALFSVPVSVRGLLNFTVSRYCPTVTIPSLTSPSLPIHRGSDGRDCETYHYPTQHRDHIQDLYVQVWVPASKNIFLISASYLSRVLFVLLARIKQKSQGDPSQKNPQGRLEPSSPQSLRAASRRSHRCATEATRVSIFSDRYNKVQNYKTCQTGLVLDGEQNSAPSLNPPAPLTPPFLNL